LKCAFGWQNKQKYLDAKCHGLRRWFISFETAKAEAFKTQERSFSVPEKVNCYSLVFPCSDPDVVPWVSETKQEMRGSVT
jgi:hypothetical protein